jgi:hypothetical protein
MQIFESVETSPEAEEIYFVVQTGRKEMFIFFTAPSFRHREKNAHIHENHKFFSERNAE